MVIEKALPGHEALLSDGGLAKTAPTPRCNDDAAFCPFLPFFFFLMRAFHKIQGVLSDDSCFDNASIARDCYQVWKKRKKSLDGNRRKMIFFLLIQGVPTGCNNFGLQGLSPWNILGVSYRRTNMITQHCSTLILDRSRFENTSGVSPNFILAEPPFHGIPRSPQQDLSQWKWKCRCV